MECKDKKRVTGPRIDRMLIDKNTQTIFPKASQDESYDPQRLTTTPTPHRAPVEIDRGGGVFQHTDQPGVAGHDRSAAARAP